MIKEKPPGREQVYDPALKIAVAVEYLTGPLGFTKIARKFGIEKHETVRHFVKWYKKHYPNGVANEGYSETLAVSEQPVGSPVDTAALDALQKELQLANLKIAALQTMISIASKELGVDIVKKHGAKQSGK